MALAITPALALRLVPAQVFARTGADFGFVWAAISVAFTVGIARAGVFAVHSTPAGARILGGANIFLVTAAVRVLLALVVTTALGFSVVATTVVDARARYFSRRRFLAVLLVV